jgi:hypothetical protein
MAVTVSNLIMGPGTLYFGDFGAIEPDSASGDPDDNEWTDCGGTNDGVTLSINQTYTELDVDQIVDVPERRLTKREMSLQTNLAEPTLENLALAMNITMPSGHELEPSDDTSATQPLYRALMFDGIAPDSKQRRVIGRKMLQTDEISAPYKKDDQTLFPATFSAHYVSDSVRPFILQDATGGSSS